VVICGYAESIAEKMGALWKAAPQIRDISGPLIRSPQSIQVTPNRPGNTQPAIYIRPVVIPRGDKYIIEFLTDAMRHGQMRVPAGAVGGA
jgi:hypothetical protein